MKMYEFVIKEMHNVMKVLNVIKLNYPRFQSIKTYVCYSIVRTDYFGDSSLLCQCMPACYEISYNKEMSTSPVRIDFSWSKF